MAQSMSSTFMHRMCSTMSRPATRFIDARTRLCRSCLRKSFSTAPARRGTIVTSPHAPSERLHLATVKQSQEEDLFHTISLGQVKKFMAKPRFDGIKRSYTERDVATKRGTLMQSYASSIMAKKLLALLEEKARTKRPLHVLGTIDPVQMTQQALHQEALYISGWACSSLLTTTNEVSPDFGDYPYNTVPNQVQRLFKAQQLHDRRHWDERRKMTAYQRDKTPYIDYLRPIIADGDTGHGGLTAVMKLAKLFAENGAAAVHFEDQLHGAKKCGHLAGKVLVPMGEHVNRLNAVRFQWDLMECQNLIIARTDAATAKLLSSSIDVRDHAFILGTTEPGESLAEILQDLEDRGKPSHVIDEHEARWLKNTKLVTFDEAAEMELSRQGKAEVFEQYKSHVDKTRDLSLPARRDLVKSLAGIEVPFSWDRPRTREGFYHYQAGIESATRRAIAYGSYADLLWLETSTPDLAVATSFAREIRKTHPGKKFVYNLSPSFNWMGQGFDETTLRSFVWDLARAGFVLQLISLAGVHSTALITAELSKKFAQDGMLAYVELIQKREKELGVDVLKHQKWSGANYVDDIIGAVQGGNSGQKSMGSGNTEDHF